MGNVAPATGFADAGTISPAPASPTDLPNDYACWDYPGSVDFDNGTATLLETFTGGGTLGYLPYFTLVYTVEYRFRGVSSHKVMRLDVPYDVEAASMPERDGQD